MEENQVENKAKITLKKRFYLPFFNGLKIILFKMIFIFKNIICLVFNIKTIGVRALVVTETEVLLVRHTYCPEWWLTVGGGLEKRETPLDGLKREVTEEIGLEIKEAHLTGVYLNNIQGRQDYVLYYIIKGPKFIPILCPHEILEARWFSFSDLPENISPATQRRVDEYLGKRKEIGIW